jgi:hypothetical protein
MIQLEYSTRLTIREELACKSEEVLYEVSHSFERKNPRLLANHPVDSPGLFEF